MQVTETSSEGLKREYRIIVEHGDIDRLMTTKLAALSHRVRVPGFRPGKAPASLLKRQYGKSMMGEVLEEALRDSTQKTLEGRKLRPALQPRIEVTRFEEGSDLEYTMAIEVLPEFAAGDFSNLKLERLVTEPADEDVDAALRRMADQQKSFAPVAEPRAATVEDSLLVDFVGKVDGVAFDGGSAQDFEMALAPGGFVPGFAEQLIGVMPGETRTIKVRFPDDYGNADLAGKEAEFEVAVKEVRELVKVAIDDEFAKRFGLDSLDALRNTVRDQLRREYVDMARSRLKRNLLDLLAERYDFPVPEGMVEIEFKQIWDQLVQEAGSEEALAARESSSEKAKEECKQLAERRVRLGLVLAEVGQQNHIEVQGEELTRAMLEQARRFPGQERQVMDYFRNNPEAATRLRAPILEDKAVDFILEMAQVEERKVSPDELVKALEAMEAEATPAIAALAAEAAAAAQAEREDVVQAESED